MLYDGSFKISSVKINNTDVSHLCLANRLKLLVSQIIIDEVLVNGTKVLGVSAQCSVTESHESTM